MAEVCSARDASATQQQRPLTLAWAIWHRAAASDVHGLAAEFAYRAFLAFIPFFVLIANIGALIGAAVGVQNPAEHAFNLLAESLSPEVSQAVGTELDRVAASRPAGLLGGAVFATVVLGASAGASVLKGINRAYDLHERRPWWKRWLLGLGLAVLAEGVLVVGLATLVGAQLIGHVAAASPETPDAFWQLAAFARWPLISGVLLLQAALVYRIAPCGVIAWRWVTPGAVVFAIGWLAASALFTLYADVVGAYTTVFGVLGGVVVLLVWFQITAYALLLGAELNAALAPSAASGSTVSHDASSPRHPDCLVLSEPA